MDEQVNKININFYNITSNFNDILVRLCNKIVYSEDNFYINFQQKESKVDADKYLWTREKNNFLPHKLYGEDISKRDKIILFEGNYEEINRLKRFQSLIVSPCVKINKFKFFKKFLLFSYSKNKEFYLNVKNKLNNNCFSVKCYDEFSPFKWKQL